MSDAAQGVIVVNKPAGNQADVKVHLLPCSIEANCSAPVKQYFDPTFRHHKGINSDHQTATFRGRELAGREVCLPSGYCGIVLHEDQRASTDLEDRHVNVTGRFDKLQYWNLETVPSANDKLIQALQWVDVATALHRPVSNGYSNGIEDQGEKNGVS